MSAVKHWCFTINNYTDVDCESLDQLPCAYLVYGKEGANSTKHLQGYITLEKKLRRTGLKKLFRNNGVHLEPMRGTPEQAASYCKKEGNFIERGILPSGKGARTDIVAFREAIKSGATIKQLIEDHTTCTFRYYNTMERIRLHYAPERTTPPKISVYWGETGTGKTRKAWDEFPDLWVYPGFGWFDGYDGHKVALFDDFSGGEFKITYLLRLLDRYKMRVPVKGGFTNWNPEHILLTSNLNPRTWYESANAEHQKALLRRLSNITHFNLPLA